MNLYLLLILLTSWSLVITPLNGCDTGVAFTNSVLSIGRSTLANADVALLETYSAPTVERCMEDCCAGKYGKCSVASYNKNSTKRNCLHFYCQPLKQCKFLSSSTFDSFTFSKGPKTSHPVPSSHSFSSSTTKSPTTTTPKAKSNIEQLHAVEEIATFSDEQADLKNDNTTIKPRKGVTAFSPDVILPKSGIKPRKGVTLEDVPHSKYLLSGLNKSNVKPRKGVGNYSSDFSIQEESFNHSLPSTVNKDSITTKINSSDDISTNELVSELEKLFEDDSVVTSSDSSNFAATALYSISPTSSVKTYSTASIDLNSNPSHSWNSVTSSSHLIQPSFSVSPSLVAKPSASVLSSIMPTKTILVQSSSVLPLASTVPLMQEKAHLSMDEPKSLDKPLLSDQTETENEKKYKSSIHLVLSLVFGLLVLFAVLGVVAKRMYDGWQRRDYYRMNYLIDGIYNGYE